MDIPVGGREGGGGLTKLTVNFLHSRFSLFVMIVIGTPFVQPHFYVWKILWLCTLNKLALLLEIVNVCTF